MMINWSQLKAMHDHYKCKYESMQDAYVDDAKKVLSLAEKNKEMEERIYTLNNKHAALCHTMLRNKEHADGLIDFLRSELSKKSDLEEENIALKDEVKELKWIIKKLREEDTDE